MASKTQGLHRPDEPFGGVILIPLNGVAVVHRELMMEVVITFANGNESSGEMIAGCMLVIEGSLAKPVSQRVDAESRLHPNVSRQSMRPG